MIFGAWPCQMGPLGADLPANDEWIDAQAGDLILYQGNQLVRR